MSNLNHLRAVRRTSCDGRGLPMLGVDASPQTAPCTQLAGGISYLASLPTLQAVLALGFLLR